MTHISFVFVFVFGFLSAHASPGTLTYQGRIVKETGAPLEYGNVSFLFEITNPLGTCVIYREQKDGVNMINSHGVFDVPIGTGTKLYPLSPTFSLLDAFKNSFTHDCYGGSTYNAASGDTRLLKVQFHDGSGWKVISPANEIRSVPFSAYSLSAEKLGDKLPGDFVQKSSVTSCTPGQYLTFDGANFACEEDSRFSDARPPTGTASGDLSGNYPNPTVTRIQGVSVSATTPTSGHFMKYNGSNWLSAQLAIADVTNLSSTLSGLQTSVDAKVPYSQIPVCSASQTLIFISPVGGFSCTNISVTETQISGSISASKISGSFPASQLPEATTSEKGIMQVGSGLTVSSGVVAVDTGTTANKIPKLDGSGNLVLTKQAAAGIFNNNAATSFDFNNGNVQYTTASCGAFVLSNMLDGASYQISVRGGTSGTCTFAHAGLSFYFYPPNGPTTAGTHSLYSFVRHGGIVYVSWTTGFAP
ncbi:hypothetical protein [Bdellovibrio bacteriovorus]|uniref:hypothetical protein n=1 Tax=Bdellovibrio bacteriovorus TaxID=959 RepID=UPI0035A67315